VCGCTPTTCSAQGKNCGSIADGCGGTLTCGSCTSPQTCGGGGTANVCGGGSTLCSVTVGTNTCATSGYDGWIYFTNNTGHAITNPVLTFNVGSETIDTSTNPSTGSCVLAPTGSTTAPGCTGLTCTQSGSTAKLSFTGTLAAGATIQAYYSPTNEMCKGVATAIAVNSSSCP
jgi:hypothetical protein